MIEYVPWLLGVAVKYALITVWLYIVARIVTRAVLRSIHELEIDECQAAESASRATRSEPTPRRETMDRPSSRFPTE